MVLIWRTIKIDDEAWAWIEEAATKERCGAGVLAGRYLEERVENDQERIDRGDK